MAMIHPTAIVDPTAQLGEGVVIGAFSMIGPYVELGDNCQIQSHVVIDERTVLGEGCVVHPGAVIGGPPQDLSFKNEPTRVRVGAHSILRECVTIHRPTGEGNETVLGEHCFMMAYSHVAHNGRLGDHVIIANGSQLGGHVTVGDYAFIGGGCMIHQHVRIGQQAMLGGGSATRQDLPPFGMNDGFPSQIRGVNTVGMRRRGFTSEERMRIKKAYFYLWYSGLNQANALERIRAELMPDPHIEHLVDFVASSKRGISHKHTVAHTVSTPEGASEPLEV